MDLNKMRIVVTGGCGFIGSHLVAKLAMEGAEIVIIDDLTSGRVENIIGIQGSINHINMSITEDIEKYMVGAEAVFHLAANVSVIKSIENPLYDAEVNVKGTVNLLETARKLDIERVIYSSSCAVYGDTETIPSPENIEPQPTAPYGNSKHIGELYCKLYSNLYGIRTVSLRYFNVYGLRQAADSPYSGVIAIFIKNAIEKKPLIIYGDGEQSRDFVSVADVVRANIMAFESDHNGEVFNIGTGVGTSINQLADYVEGFAGELGREHTEARKGEIKHSLADMAKTEKILGYEPTVSLEQGLKVLYESNLAKK